MHTTVRTKWKWYFVTKIVLTYCEKKILLLTDLSIN